MAQKNVFVLALTELQRTELETVHDIGDVAFHGLFDVETLVESPEIHFNQLLERCREELRRFPGTIDGIIAHWDFPTSVLVPILCRDYKLPSPSLESVLKCEHKYWSRLEQEQSIPDFIPGFCSFDPFDDDALDKISLNYPFWIKPVKSFSSQLGFRIENAEEFQDAMVKMRDEIHHIGDAFEEAMTHADVPEEIRALSGSACLAEEIIIGTQSAPEGTVFNGQFSVHGAFDMLYDEIGKSFGRFVYPSTFPAQVQQRMNDACETFLRHIGFDNGCFNAEFMWDEERDILRLIEFNTRISQAHSEMFIKVDGQSNHQVAVDVALGIKPVMPHREGEYAVAAKCFIHCYEADAVITRVPDEAELQALKARFPSTEIIIDVKAGMRLSELANQDAYSYILGEIYIAANSDRELLENFDHCVDSLGFEMYPVKEDSSQMEREGDRNANDHLTSV